MKDLLNSKNHLAHERIGQEWLSLINKTPAFVKTLVGKILQQNETGLQKHYLNYLEQDPDICHVIHSDRKRLEFSNLCIIWMKDLLELDGSSYHEFIAKQEATGEMMARINYPPYAISRGIRHIILWYIGHLNLLSLSTEEHSAAVNYVFCLLNISLELREIGYQRGVASYSRIDEAYRLHSLSQNLGVERERQRAELMEWSHQLLTSFHQASTPCVLPRIWRSAFGHWLDHKARILFERTPDIQRVIQAANRIDQELLPVLEQADFANRVNTRELVNQIDQELSAIKYSMNTIFEIYQESENGRDPLTQLLNRRFMVPVLSREIGLQKTARDNGFCVLLLDIDHFKKINDEHGHAAGDIVLQSSASLISRCIRPSDFVFRYGGEEILLVLIDCSLEMGWQIAEKIRQQLASSSISLASQDSVNITVSIGLASFAGELDYQALIMRADQAMYAAKQGGRNRVCVSAAADHDSI